MVHNLPAPEGLESFRVRGENVGPVVLIGKNLTENAKDYQISAHTQTHTQREGDGVWWALRGLIRVGLGDDEAHSWIALFS